MNGYYHWTAEERQAELKRLREKHAAWCASGLSLNMARGKPGQEQLALSSALLTAPMDPADCVSDGVDVRNYGTLSGLPAAKALFAELLGCKPEQCFIGGNSSLQLMYNVISLAYTHGLPASPRPWAREETVRWLCPVPGYDRHFAISQSFGMEMLPVPLGEDGPDMDAVRELVQDPTVKGIWCVPKFSNPEGVVYSEETVRAFASLKPAAPDFVILWDNAYCVHEFDGPFVPLPDLLSICEAAGTEDHVFEFASTSKITLPGAGISVVAAGPKNLAWFEGQMKYQIISFDKVNQLRHVRLLRDKAHTLALMERHAEVVRPRFHCVLDTLAREIAPLGLARWQTPKGGYFVCVHTLPGLAARTHALCKQAGLTLTGPGATWPGGRDPEDSVLRIAPTYPSLEELAQAIALFCDCLKLAALERLEER